MDTYDEIVGIAPADSLRVPVGACSVPGIVRSSLRGFTQQFAMGLNVHKHMKHLYFLDLAIRFGVIQIANHRHGVHFERPDFGPEPDPPRATSTPRERLAEVCRLLALGPDPAPRTPVKSSI